VSGGGGLAVDGARAAALARADALVTAMARLTARLEPAPELVGGATALSHLTGLVTAAVYRPDLAVLASQGRAARARIGWLGQEDAALLAEGGGRVPLDLPTIFARVVSGRFAIWISPAQIDRLGNANISRIGPAERPRPALVGSRGLPDDSVSLPAGLYYVTRHDPRSVVARVDFVSAVGDRRRLPVGSRARGRPAYLVSDLGVFDFAGPEGGLRLRVRMPGVDVAEIARRTPFAVDGMDDAPELAPPTTAERAAIARFDPLGVRALECAADPDLAGRLREELRREEEALVAPAARAYLAALGLVEATA
jgi:glutaconate CoA-transferase subunit B